MSIKSIADIIGQHVGVVTEGDLSILRPFEVIRFNTSQSIIPIVKFCKSRKDIVGICTRDLNSKYAFWYKIKTTKPWHKAGWCRNMHGLYGAKSPRVCEVTYSPNAFLESFYDRLEGRGFNDAMAESNNK